MARPKRVRLSEVVEQSGITFPWNEYVEEDTLTQLNKLPEPKHLLARLTAFEWYGPLLQNWHYQYVIAWLYNVCNSYTTANNNYYYSEENGKKTMLWKDVNFDELTFLQDYMNHSDFESFGDSNYDWNDDNNLDDGEILSIYEKIKLRLIKQISNSKSNQLEDWHKVITHYLSIEGQSFDYSKLSVQEQFEIIYKMIKVIEKKSMMFRNYLLNNEDIMYLFQYPEIETGENESLIILPQVGTIIQKKTITSSKASLHIPIKLQNCTVKYENDELSTLDLIHLDYSTEINNYLNSIKPEYKTITNDWISFLSFMQDAQVNNIKVFNFFASYIQIYAEHLIQVRKFFTQKSKEQSMADLLTRRKRSSRLVAREEETKKKDVEHQWLEKLDEKEHYIKTRNRVIARQQKKVKEVLWNILWGSFEQDLKSERIRNRNNPLAESPAYISKCSEDPELKELSQNDITVCNNGINFNTAIIKVGSTNNEDMNQDIIRELPARFCITQQILDEAASIGISTVNELPDDLSWVFQCDECKLHSDAENSESAAPTKLIVKTVDDVTPSIMNHQIVCCDGCYRWQHWDCQKEKIIEILTICNAQKNKNAALLNAQDFGAVLLNDQPLGSRRSTRHQSPEAPSVDSMFRPTDKRGDIQEHYTFFCEECLSNIEKGLRSTFVAELSSVRSKKRKQQEDRERRKKEKELKRSKQEANRLKLQLQAAASSNPVDVSSAASILEPSINNSNPINSTVQQVHNVTSKNPPMGTFVPNRSVNDEKSELPLQSNNVPLTQTAVIRSDVNEPPSTSSVAPSTVSSTPQVQTFTTDSNGSVPQ